MTQDHTRDGRHGREHTDGRRTLGEIDHTHPHTGNAFGDTLTFERGTALAADGGERGPGAGDDEEQGSDDPDEADRLRDVDHTPRKESDGANGVYERGHEGREREEDA